MAFGEYIKFFKGCSVLNAKQAHQIDSLQKYSEKMKSATVNVDVWENSAD